MHLQQEPPTWSDLPYALRGRSRTPDSDVLDVVLCLGLLLLGGLILTWPH
jgi:hypothetical protein